MTTSLHQTRFYGSLHAIILLILICCVFLITNQESIFLYVTALPVGFAQSQLGDTIVNLKFNKPISAVLDNQIDSEKYITVAISNTTFFCINWEDSYDGGISLDRIYNDSNEEVDNRETDDVHTDYVSAAVKAVELREKYHRRDSRMKSISGDCYAVVGSNLDVWTYDICINSRVTQYRKSKLQGMQSDELYYAGVHDEYLDEVYSNGTIVQHYTGGTSGRRSVVKFMCSKDQVPRITEGFEDPKLVYNFVFTAPQFCDWSGRDNDQLDYASLLWGIEGTCLNHTSPFSEANIFWSYEYCYPDSLMQFTTTADGAADQIFLLGVVEWFSSKNAWLNTGFPPLMDSKKLRSQYRSTMNSTSFPLFPNLPIDMIDMPHLHTYGIYQPRHRLLALQMTKGDICEVTNQPREARILFECDEELFRTRSTPKILSVYEISTCKYVVHIYAPQVCAHPKLLPPRHEEPQVVSCHPEVKPPRTPVPSLNVYHGLPTAHDLRELYERRLSYETSDVDNIKPTMNDPNVVFREQIM